MGLWDDICDIAFCVKVGIYIYMWPPCLQMADGPWTKIPWIWGILYQTDPFIYNYRRFQDQICGADVASMALEVTIYPAVCEQLV